MEEPDLGWELGHKLRPHPNRDLRLRRRCDLMAQPEFELVAQQREQPKPKL
jgi:hypothetical protein